MKDVLKMPDIQNLVDRRNLVIDKVGVKKVRHPFIFTDSEVSNSVVGSFDLYVNLAADKKGTHMSRFIELLHDDVKTISINNFPNISNKILNKFSATSSEIKVDFDWFKVKTAPVSKVESLMDYKISLKIININKKIKDYSINIAVPVTSLCPCSKEISLYGAHNQRSVINISVKINPNSNLKLDDLILIAENSASCDLYGILKRQDEKFVTEKAYSNPKFVEDMVREVAIALNSHQEVLAYSVEVENFESIHNHSAYAMIEKL